MFPRLQQIAQTFQFSCLQTCIILMAFSAAALQGVTLKKTVTREAPALVQTICTNEEQYQKLMQVQIRPE